MPHEKGVRSQKYIKICQIIDYCKMKRHYGKSEGTKLSDQYITMTQDFFFDQHHQTSALTDVKEIKKLLNSKNGVDKTLFLSLCCINFPTVHAQHD